MDVCFSHDIAYTARSCPACELAEELKEAEIKIQQLEDTVNELERKEG
jgi:hypothetical protein